ncbi:MAG TPA: DUF3019 domain-containing protein [Marinagarivorans sp.]
MTALNAVKLIIPLGIVFSFSFPLMAEPNQLVIKPQKCVSLHEGQICYQQVTFQWLSAKEQPLCLYLVGSSKPMTCATTSERISFTLDFKASNEQTFELRSSGGDIVSTATIEVVSVYKGKRRATTGWRLF